MKAAFASSVKSSTAAKAGLASVVVGAGLAAKALYDIGSEFDSAYDTIRVGTGKTGKELEKLKSDFKNVVSSVPADFDDAATAVAELNKRLGVTGKPLRQLGKQFLELSRITETDIGENVKTVTRAFGDWEVKTKDQTKTLDLFFRASQMSGATVSELADNVVKFGAPFRQFGFDIGEATAMFASFEKAGVNIQTMVPGLKFALKTFLGEDRDPKNALQNTFKGIEDGSIDASKALDIFGQRAGADMVEAVEQGRFHLDKFTRQIEKGKDSIRRAGKETMDAEENFKLLGNKLKVLVEPAATAVYEAFGKLSGRLAKVNFKRVLREAGLTKGTMRDVSAAVKDVSRVVGPVLNAVLDRAGDSWKHFIDVTRNAAKVISGVLTLDMGKAIDGFGGLFKTGINLVIGYLNTLIGAINRIPGIPDIGEIGTIGGGGGGPRKRYGGRNATPKGRQRGGPIWGGDASGDSVPAMLERGEYVLNRNAVKAVGKPRLDAINFAAAPRFSVGSFIGDAAKTAVSPFGLANAAGRGADYFIDRLPKPNLPEPFTGLGPYALEKVAEWIKGKVGSVFGGGGPGSSNIIAVGKWLQSMGYQVGEHPFFGGVGTHTAGSYHYSGRAIDVNADGMPGGEARWLDKIFPVLKRMNPAELLWRVPDHFDHLHVAFQKGGIVGQFANVIRSTNAPYSAALALYEAGLVESGMRNLPYGDADSTGVLQVRASTAAPMGIDPMNVGQVARAFLTKGFWGKGSAISLAKAGYSSGTIAQMVQGSEFGSRYGEQREEAEALLRESGLRFNGQTLRAATGGGTVRAEDGSRVPKGFYAQAGIGKAERAQREAKLRKKAVKLPNKNKQGIGGKRAVTGPFSGKIGSNVGGLFAEAAAAGEVGEGEETDAQRQQREALEANTAAMEDHARELQGVRDELKQTREFAKSATATSSATAWRALADILSGELGPRSFARAQTAGAGSVGTF